MIWVISTKSFPRIQAHDQLEQNLRFPFIVPSLDRSLRYVRPLPTILWENKTYVYWNRNALASPWSFVHMKNWYLKMFQRFKFPGRSFFKELKVWTSNLYAAKSPANNLYARPNLFKILSLLFFLKYPNFQKMGAPVINFIKHKRTKVIEGDAGVELLPTWNKRFRSFHVAWSINLVHVSNFTRL